jgi:hypothetical protein
MMKSSRAAYDCALLKNRACKNSAISKLEPIDRPCRQEPRLDGLPFATGRAASAKAPCAAKPAAAALPDFPTPPDYSLRDLLNRQKGSLQSIKCLWQELMRVDFEGETEFKVPVVFVGGRHDQHVSSPLAYAYLNALRPRSNFIGLKNPVAFPNGANRRNFMKLWLLSSLQRTRRIENLKK